jgi:hypothetical protein
MLQPPHTHNTMAPKQSASQVMNMNKKNIASVFNAAQEAEDLIETSAWVFMNEDLGDATLRSKPNE